MPKGQPHRASEFGAAMYMVYLAPPGLECAVCRVSSPVCPTVCLPCRLFALLVGRSSSGKHFASRNGLIRKASRIGRARRAPILSRQSLRPARRNGLCRKASRIERGERSLLYRKSYTFHSSMQFCAPRYFRSFCRLSCARRNGLCRKASRIGRARRFLVLYIRRPTLCVSRCLYIVLSFTLRSLQRATPKGQPHWASEAPCSPACPTLYAPHWLSSFFVNFPPLLSHPLHSQQRAMPNGQPHRASEALSCCLTRVFTGFFARTRPLRSPQRAMPQGQPHRTS